MGYTTNFRGYFKLDRKLTDELYNDLIILHNTRHDNDDFCPSIWCDWKPTEDRMAIVWDHAEKFYEYENWIRYIIKQYLEPNNYKLHGRVLFQGERIDDCGYINIKDNVVTIEKIDIPDDYISGI